MNRDEIVSEVRNFVRDGARAVFTDVAIINHINSGIQRIRQRIPMLSGMVKLTERNQSPILLPVEYHDLLVLYAASRCFFIDERHYQAGNMMNEFEIKLDELKAALLNGDVTLTNENGEAIAIPINNDYVVDNYFNTNSYLEDIDEGVEGVV
jgi:hypothetical protein